MERRKGKRKRSEAFLDVLFQFAIAMSLIFCFVALWKPFIYKQNMDYMAKTLVRAVEASGCIDSDILVDNARIVFGKNTKNAEQEA